MDLHVSLAGSGDLTAQIYAQLRAAVLDGRLAGGDRVPASRDLATSLSVSRGTVTAAYDRLLAEELLETRRGAGTFVASGCVPPGGEAGRRARAGAVVPTALWATIAEAAPGPGGAVHDFSVGVPDDSLFPLATWRRLVSGTLRRGRLAAGTYDDPGANRGGSRLEGEIARYAGVSRSVVASGADVVTTAGAQQALDLVARVLVEPGDTVAVEDPGYTAAAHLFATHRAVVRGVPVDGEGIVVDALPDAARLVYVTPSHQHPTGVAMSRARRVALLEWAVRHEAVIVEDDYDSEFRFADRPLEPLQSLDRDGRVVYVGSFSKSLLPGLRVGYAIAPATLTPALREAKRVTVWDGDAVTHGALADFLSEGHHAAHVKRATKVYRARRDALLEALDSTEGLGEWLEVIPSAAGLHVCALLRDPDLDDVAIAEQALAAGVFVEPLSVRHLEQRARHGLAFGVGGIPLTGIGPALTVLRGVLSSSRPGRPDGG
ncbi:PLP-dependent aminotransferase family protein [Terrabacter sp. Ter38]|uniref:MocR-like pyridoxine biosynthesis transcription factor PdxR n=1 Tax=Terrabacter sp. Ter38 TaxID=2926030 RepID=UPI0021182043|nr:PLP-dependent aminotransferase family protein [Terrabacter sp. Ter38]